MKWTFFHFAFLLFLPCILHAQVVPAQDSYDFEAIKIDGDSLEEIGSSKMNGIDFGDIDGFADKQKDSLWEPGPNDFILLEKEPKPLNLDEIKMKIGYPAEAKELEISGKVIVRILVSESGIYLKHIIIKNPNPVLTSAVESKIPGLRFSPGMLDGKNVKSWLTVPFDFVMIR